jgi:HK97 family phage prohead protease
MRLVGYAALWMEPGCERGLATTQGEWTGGGRAYRHAFRRGAFADTLRRHRDVTAVIDHDGARVLGRLGSGLELREDSIGMYFALDIPATRDGFDVLDAARRGRLQGVSPRFSCSGGEFFTAEKYGFQVIERVGRLEHISICLDHAPAWKQTRGYLCLVAAPVREPLRAW